MTTEGTDAAVSAPAPAPAPPANVPAGPFIRPYRRSDRDAVFEICLRTAAGGGDATGVYSDDALMPEVFALPYVEYAPDLAFVVDDGTGRAVGYVLGVADTRAFVEWWQREWGPAFRTRHPHPGPPTGRDPGFTEDPAAPNRGAPATIVEDGEHAVEVEASLAANGLLVLADTYYPGWRATVNGMRAPVLPANAWMRAVPVPAGRSRVVLSYRSRYLLAGALVSAAALALMAAALVRGRRESAAA